MKAPILYIDDEQANLTSFRMALGIHFKIYLANTIGEAFRALENNEIKVLVSDQKMPEMNGLDFVSEVKKRYPDIVCMILTAYSDVDIVLKAINQGDVHRFILKPWDNEEMIQVLRNAAGQYDLKTENKALIQRLRDKNEELEAYAQELLATSNNLAETNEKLLEAKAKAEESDRLKSAFLANMSHEIRTPMNGIIGFSEMLSLPDLKEEKRQYYTGIVIKSADQLLRILNDIIDISKIETGQVVLHIEEFSLCELLSDLCQFYAPQAEEKGLVFHIAEKQQQRCNFTSDRTKVQQIVSNLISNAIKFTHKGYVEIGTKHNGESVTFYVKDSGIGISQENQELIFERFRQVETGFHRTYGGTGLGLSISKALTKELGGELTLKSELGKGSTFSFTLPNKPIS